MNFLAHAYLSGTDDELLVGNMVADFVKGKNMYSYSAGIQKGISLHREIDRFTDAHPLVKSTRKLFYPVIRHYALVVSDVIFDHYLGRHWERYHAQPLGQFTAHTYSVLEQYSPELPERFQWVLSRMAAHDWMGSYATWEGLSRSFEGLSHRSPEFTFPAETMDILQAYYDIIEEQFLAFFPELISLSLAFRQ